MYNDIFRSLTYDLQNRNEYNLAFQLQRDLMMNELYDRQKWEQIKKEITDDVMSRIKIMISSDTTAIDELAKKIDKNKVNFECFRYISM